MPSSFVQTPITNPYEGVLTPSLTILRLGVALLFALISLLAIVPPAQAATTTGSVPAVGSSSSGYAVYSAQVTQNGTQHNFSVNESVTRSTNPGKSILLLAVDGTSSNFTYSHLVNSSLAIFPYIPAISSENFTYANKSYDVTAKISQRGTTEVNFQGKTYTLTDYAFSANIVSVRGSQTLSGNVSAFPSDLVYSFVSQINSTRIAVTLTSTSLALSTTSTSPVVQAASAGLGISLAAAAVVLSLGVKVRRKHQSEGRSKPDHWVD